MRRITQYRDRLLVCLLLLLGACATAGLMAGEPKNSLPVVNKAALEEVHTIAIPAFHADRLSWRSIAFHTLRTSNQKLRIIELEQTDAAARSSRKDIATLPPQERAEALAALGRQLQADAVLNGVVLQHEERQELVLQLLAAKDGRVLYWQAVDYSYREGGPADARQAEVMAALLKPVSDFAARRPKPVPASAAPAPPKMEPQRQEPPVETDSSQKSDRKTAPGKKRKGTKQPASDDVSPM